RSVAAIGVAAHEVGHALQYAKGYVPMKLRAAIIPVTNIGSSLAWPLVLLGIFLSYPILAYLGVILFGFVTLFQFVTLPVEFNASRRALKALTDSNTLSNDELRGSKKVLTAAALTYVAALVVSIGNFLRLLIISGRSRRR
ncbi:MAG: zinc metallopeptidase, partial [Oscillospiraceae bacterium]|nr:zinc metallopeptidase [Oscillospiraceae bacterium]